MAGIPLTRSLHEEGGKGDGGGLAPHDVQRVRNQSWRRVEDFGSLNLWFTQQLHHLAAEVCEGVRDLKLENEAQLNISFPFSQPLAHATAASS